MRPNYTKRSAGYILVGALALAVILAVAASMAFLSSQQKVDEERSKEANINARLAMDSQASRILTLLDRTLESSGIYQSGNVMGVPLGDVASGPFQVATMQVLNPTVQLGPDSIYFQPLSFHSTDPFFSDLRMDTTQFQVQINATSTNFAYQNYAGTYTYQVRAVPIADFGVFNPGTQTEAITLGNEGNITDGYVHQSNAWAYVGFLSGTYTQGAWSYGPLSILNASQEASDPNIRLFRQSSYTNSGAAGVAKWVNGPSSGFATMLGRYENFAGNYPDIDSGCTAYGMLYDNGQGQSLSTSVDPMTLYGAVAQSITGSPLAQPYQIIQVSTGNPLYNLENQGYIATVDLGRVNSGPAMTGPVDRTVLLGVPPSTNGVSINTIVVTNCGLISGSLNLSFPPNIDVFFADNVNTNLARLRVEGDLGFLPVLGIDITTITNSTQASRLTNQTYYTSMSTNVLRPAILVDLTNQDFAYTPEYLALESQLYSWATNIQVQLLSDSSGPWYIPNASLVNYFTQQIKLYHLNETCAPLITIQTDWATNLTQGIHTNTFNEYSYGGYTVDTGVCGTPAGYYVLNGDPVMLDPLLPTNYIIIAPLSPLVLIDNLVTGNTNNVQINFQNMALAQLHNDVVNPVSGYYIDNGFFYTWASSNASPAALAAPLQPDGNPLLSPCFAMTWMTLEPVQTYDEHFLENYQLAQATGQAQVIATNQPSLSDFSMTDMHPTAGIDWYDYLEQNWAANITDPEVPPRPTFRFDSAGNLVTNVGAWMRTSSSIMQDTYDFSQTTTRDESNLSTNDYAAFNVRQVVFHYQTMGWTMTNLVIASGPAPQFNGRAVIESGFNQVLTLVPTNLVVHGQVTYTHRIRSYAEPENVIGINAYAVDHTQATYQTNSAERIYDVRISRVDTHSQ